LGARLSNGEYALYQLSLIPPDPVVEVVDDYCAIGTGMNYAYLLLRQQTRAVLTSGMKMADSDLESNVWLGAFAINEIKTFDKHTSGNTRVAIIDGNGFREYNRKEIIDRYEAKRDEIANIISRLGIDKEVARSLYPDP
jgi:20S proteasome alpha/beta subunit